VPAPYTGGCQCGSVRYVLAEPIRLAACHCKECQRKSGSAFGMSMPVKKEGAETYLKQVDPGWDAPQTISPESKLYLDDLTVNYLDHVGLLAILTNSVAAVFVHR
jgi:Glutathione-dependent formaldehyde-activating enzyme